MDSDTRPTIYVSSKRQHTQLWRVYRHRGWRIVSSWIDLDDAIEAETLGHTYWPLWLNEAAMADYLLFYAHPQDGSHSENLLEIGAALVGGATVLHVGVSSNMKTQDGEMSAFTYHPKWVRFASIALHHGSPWTERAFPSERDCGRCKHLGSCD